MVPNVALQVSRASSASASVVAGNVSISVGTVDTHPALLTCRPRPSATYTCTHQPGTGGGHLADKCGINCEPASWILKLF